MLSHCFAGNVGSSIGFLFSIGCKSSYIYIPNYRIATHCLSQSIGYPKPAHNILPYKLNDLFVFDGCEGFGLYPFAEVVGGNQQQLLLSRGDKQWPNYVNAPLSEGSGACYGC